MILLLIPLLIGLMWLIAGHYREVDEALAVPWTDPRLPRAEPRVIVPIARLDRPSLEALRYARSMSTRRHRRARDR